MTDTKDRLAEDVHTAELCAACAKSFLDEGRIALADLLSKAGETITRLIIDAQRAESSEGLETPRPMETAPRDGTMVRLLVEFTEHATEDSPDPSWTIGANNDDNVGEGEGEGWKFAGWCWCHDHFTQGEGKPVGWLPMLSAESGAGVDGWADRVNPRPHTQENGIPTRCYINRMSAPELAIYQAINAVEKWGGSWKLTEAVNLLGRARDCVADHVEGNGDAPVAKPLPLSPTYYVRHPDDSYSVADPQPESRADKAMTRMEQLRKFCEWEAEHNPSKTHIAAWALQEIIALRAERKRCSIPDGYVPVPIEPTDAMVEAVATIKLDRLKDFAHSGPDGKGLKLSIREEYKALLAAAPEKDHGG